MEINLAKERRSVPVLSRVSQSSSRSLKIAFCLPDVKALDQVTSGQLTDASYIQQGYIADGLKDRGHQLTLIAPHQLDQVVYTSEGGKRSFAPQTWTRHHWFNLLSKVSWRVQRLLGIPYLNVFSNYRLCDAYQQCLPGHDLVHERNNLYRIGAAMACKRLGLPFVLFFDADEILEYDVMGKPIKGLLRWRARELARYNLSVSNCVICVSETIRVQLITAWGIRADKIIVLPNGVDIQRFCPDPETSQVRALLGVHSDPLIMFVGNFYEWHDVVTLLHAFSRVLVTCPGARLVLVGDGAKREAMVQYASEIGIAHAVQFVGLIPHVNVPKLLSAADIAVAPYPSMSHEMWMSPMKLFEYFSAGKAVVASSVGQVAQVVTDGTNGLLVPPGDASAMAAALLRLISDPALRAQLGQAARSDAVQKYSWENYITRLESVYAAVVSGQPINPN